VEQAALFMLAFILLARLAATAQDSVPEPGTSQAAFFEEHVLWQNKEENAWPYHVYGLVQSTQGACSPLPKGGREREAMQTRIIWS